ncbi:MAG: serine hydrolase domain-containing protein, partial [Bacteroidota bacterium]
EEQGKLSLQDDVRKYLPDLPDFGQVITLDHLLSQSSGLHEYPALRELAGLSPTEILTNQTVLNWVKNQQQLDFVPGTDFSGTHTGFVLLAEVVQKVTGQSLADYTKTNIFEPLQMRNTEFKGDVETIISNKANSYQATENGFKKRLITNATVGTSNLYTSAADLARWYLNLDNPTVGSANLMKKMRSPVRLTNGKTYDSMSGQLHYNQQFYHLERGEPAYWNYGLTGGYGTNIFTFPEQGITTFVLGNNNQYNGWPAMSMAYELIGDAFPEPESVDFGKLNIVQLSEKELAAHEGYYWDEKASLARRIFVKNDTLRYGRLGSPRESLLVPLSKNKFQMVVESDDVIIINFDKENGQKVMKLTGGESDPFVYHAYEPVTYGNNNLAQFTGRFYSSALNTTYELSVKDQQLVASHFRKNDVAFTPVKKDIFTGSTWYFGGIQFERDSRQQITGFTVNFDGVKGLRFEKI